MTSAVYGPDGEKSVTRSIQALPLLGPSLRHCDSPSMAIHKNTPAAGVNLTAAPLKPGVEWLRPADVRHTHGIGRSLLYELINEGKVRSICLRREGRATGMRLISAQSLNEFIVSHAEGRE